MSSVLRPRALSRGDLVAVAAPSGALDAGDKPFLERGIAMLEQMGFRVRVTPLVDTRRRRWWASGSPQEQAAELNTLFRDPEVRAIAAHTGGQATLGYLDLLDLDAIRADPKPIIGYSDISVLHLALYARTGLVGFHSDLTTHGFGLDWYALADEKRRDQLLDVYANALTKAEAPGPLPTASVWECWRPGQAQGTLVGGMLNRIVRLQATSFAMPPERFDGAVLFWEEMGRPLPEVWSNLHALRLSGVLDRIAAMVVGIPHNLTLTDWGSDSPSLRDVVLDVLGERDLPVIGHVDFGHTAPNLPLPLGVRAEVDATTRTLSLIEPVVEAR